MRLVSAFVLAALMVASIGCGGDDKKTSAPDNPTAVPKGKPGEKGLPGGSNQPPPPPSVSP